MPLMIIIHSSHNFYSKKLRAWSLTIGNNNGNHLFTFANLQQYINRQYRNRWSTWRTFHFTAYLKKAVFSQLSLDMEYFYICHIKIKLSVKNSGNWDLSNKKYYSWFPFWTIFEVFSFLCVWLWDNRIITPFCTSPIWNTTQVERNGIFWLLTWFDKKNNNMYSFDFPVNRVKIKILFFKPC